MDKPAYHAVHCCNIPITSHYKCPNTPRIVGCIDPYTPILDPNVISPFLDCFMQYPIVNLLNSQCVPIRSLLSSRLLSQSPSVAEFAAMKLPWSQTKLLEIPLTSWLVRSIYRFYMFLQIAWWFSIAMLNSQMVSTVFTMLTSRIRLVSSKWSSIFWGS